MTTSIMPGIAIRQDVESPFSNAVGGDEDVFTFLDVPVIMRFHVADNANKWVLGLGPVFTFCMDNDTYYFDAQPDHLHNVSASFNFHF